MEAAGSSETLVTLYQTTRLHNQEDRNHKESSELPAVNVDINDILSVNNMLGYQ
jgi:hypothetical protein